MPIGDRGLRAARQHHIGIVDRDDSRRVADGVRAGGASRHHRMVRSLVLESDRGVAGNQVDQPARNEERRDLPRPFFVQQDRAFLDAGKTADARTDHHAGAAALFLVLGLPAGIGHRLLCRSQPVHDEIVDPPLFLGVDPGVGIEGSVRAVAAHDIAGNLRRHAVRRKLGDRARAGPSGEQPGPSFFDAAGERRYQPQSGDNDSTHLDGWRLRVRLVDVFDGVADGDDGLGRVVGNFDAEFLFERHHQLDRVQAVGAEIFNERRGVGDLVRIHVEMLDDDLLHAFGSIAHGFLCLSLLFTAASRFFLARGVGPHRCQRLVEGPVS